MNRGKLIYVAGPITAMPNENREEFDRVSKLLRSMGHEVINPHELCAEIPKEGNPELVWLHCLKRCLPELAKCDKVVMLEGFKNSIGSMVEFTSALMRGMDVVMMSEIEEQLAVGNHTSLAFNMDN